MRSHPLRRRAVRIAAISMAVVGLLLVLLMTATDLLVARNLTAGVDDRLRDQLNRPAPSSKVAGESASDTDFSEPVLRWSVGSTGAVTASTARLRPAWR